MAAGEDDKKKEQGKGFAGLSSLVSDVDTLFLPVAKKPTTSSAGTTSEATRPPPQAVPPKPQPAPQQPYKPPQQPGSGSSAGQWWIGIAAIIGVLWLIGQSNKNTSSPAPAYTPPAQTATSGNSPPQAPPQEPSATSANTDPDLMQDGDGATYRVPSFRVEELRDSRRAARAAQQDAQSLEAQVERQNNLLNDEKNQVDQQERQLDELGNEIEQERSSIDSSNPFELDSFNSKVRTYNTNQTQLRRRIQSFNVDVNRHNELIQRAQTLERRANQMVDIYNSKLERYGTRQ